MSSLRSSVRSESYFLRVISKVTLQSWDTPGSYHLRSSQEMELFGSMHGNNTLLSQKTEMIQDSLVSRILCSGFRWSLISASSSGPFLPIRN